MIGRQTHCRSFACCRISLRRPGSITLLAFRYPHAPRDLIRQPCLWSAATMDPVIHLQNLIRCNTTNPPGNEIVAARYLADVLSRAGYAPVVLESAPGRGNVVARYKGDGSKRPLLLYNHLDVVPAEAEHWSHDPFAGVIDRGMVWGRGALDMKSIVVQQLMVMLRLARERPALRRDVIFAGCADEEVGGEMGLGFLVREHRALVDAEIGLSESGATPIYLNGHTLYAIQCGEKGSCRLVLRATAAPGHGASPDYENYAIRYLAIALERLTRAYLPTHLTTTVRNLLAALAPLVDVPADRLLDETGFEKALEQVAVPTLRQSLLHITRNSAAPTLLRAGTKINVVPGTAEAELDGRILPGYDVHHLMSEVRAAIGDDLPVEVIHVPGRDAPGLEAPSAGPVWDTLVGQLQKHDPAAVVVPTLLAGGTDAQHLAPLGVKTFGFSPMRFPRDFNWHGLVHGHDERVPIDALAWGIDVLYDTVLELCR
ncbi:MAG: M20/M25/M40 family metallo-hydrolase [Caldilineae bacterium]|nr:MAG: M20/M25/M40 family metallo-hydrolase [Caldilineae bacterium]